MEEAGAGSHEEGVGESGVVVGHHEAQPGAGSQCMVDGGQPHVSDSMPAGDSRAGALMAAADQRCLPFGGYVVDFGMDPQQAVNALRFMVGNDQVIIEEGLDEGVARELQSRGHKVGAMTGQRRVSIGGAQIIQRDRDTGVLRAGSEPRKDGCAVGW